MKLTALFLLCTLNILSMVGQEKSLYDFKVKDIDNKEYDLSQLKGKKVLIVNVASKCGLTSQYEALEQLYRKYQNQNFIIVAFPSNDFLGQEPGSNEEIKEFCQVNYDVTFPMMGKISVKGKTIHPLYKWLTMKSENGKMDAPIEWNFQKFMIDENGHLVNFVSPTVSPLCKTIVEWIESESVKE